MMQTQYCYSIALALLVWSQSLLAQTLLPPNEAAMLGKQLPNLQLRDDQGKTLDLYSLRGEPLLISPIYTKCGATCPLITQSLKQAIAPLTGYPYRLLSFDFDPQDGVAELQRFRQQQALPSSWLLATALPETLHKLLAAIDFRTIQMQGGHFGHPNLLVVLSPQLQITGYLYGVNFTTAQLAAAIEMAMDPQWRWLHLRPYILVIAVVGLVASFLALLWVLQRRQRRAHTQKNQVKTAA